MTGRTDVSPTRRRPTATTTTTPGGGLRTDLRYACKLAEAAGREFTSAAVSRDRRPALKNPLIPQRDIAHEGFSARQVMSDYGNPTAARTVSADRRK